MQQVVNCLYLKDNKALLLNKARRGWWVCPGGKVEPGETLAEACIREFYEETGLTINTPKLISIFTVLVKKEEIVDQWMFYNFFTEAASGTVLAEPSEGKLAWWKQDEIMKLPMAGGDKVIIEHALSGKGVLVGVVTYTEDYNLIDIRYSQCH